MFLAPFCTHLILTALAHNSVCDPIPGGPACSRLFVFFCFFFLLQHTWFKWSAGHQTPITTHSFESGMLGQRNMRGRDMARTCRRVISPLLWLNYRHHSSNEKHCEWKPEPDSLNTQSTFSQGGFLSSHKQYLVVYRHWQSLTLTHHKKGRSAPATNWKLKVYTCIISKD